MIRRATESPAKFVAVRAARIISLAGEQAARSAEQLNARLHVLKDAVITATAQGVILKLESYKAFRRSAPANVFFEDKGDVTLTPGLVNCHCHLELSHLRGKTIAGQGFVPWLQSLISLAAAPLTPSGQKAAVAALHEVTASQTCLLADISSRRPLHFLKMAAEQNLNMLLFLEAFGHQPPLSDLTGPFSASGYAPECSRDIAPYTDAQGNISLNARLAVSLAGHSPCTASIASLQAAKQCAQRLSAPFSLHLAEHEGEVQCLLDGQGEYAKLMRAKILPPEWQPPRKHPVHFAKELGLLDPSTLAVHCVQCGKDECAELAGTGASICLCPSSNEYINIGVAPAKTFIKHNALLCLGTDGLSSNSTLDLRAEMRQAARLWGLTPAAALRMATINGAQALGRAQMAAKENSLGTLEPGKLFCYSVWNGNIDALLS